VQARDLLEIFVDFLFRSLVMLVCIILCNNYVLILSNNVIFVLGPKKKCGFPVSSYKNLGRVGRF
jgi:hypothetical protein